MSDKLNEMWAAVEAHKPAPEYAEAWQTMLRERTPRSAWAAGLSGGGRAAAEVAWAAAEAAEAAAEAAEAAQRAIDAIREVQP